MTCSNQLVVLSANKYYKGSLLSLIYWGPDSPKRFIWNKAYATRFEEGSPELAEALAYASKHLADFNIRLLAERRTC